MNTRILIALLSAIILYGIVGSSSLQAEKVVVFMEPSKAQPREIPTVAPEHEIKKTTVEPEERVAKTEERSQSKKEAEEDTALTTGTDDIIIPQEETPARSTILPAAVLSTAVIVAEKETLKEVSAGANELQKEMKTEEVFSEKENPAQETSSKDTGSDDTSTSAKKEDTQESNTEVKTEELSAQSSEETRQKKGAEPSEKKRVRRLSIGPRLGTLGIGAEGVFRISDNWRMRILGHGGDINLKYALSDIDYKTDISAATLGALVDYHIFRGSFKVTGGVFYNGNEITIKGTPTGETSIGDGMYSPEDIGTINGKITFNDAAPYVGFGWGNVFQGIALTLHFDVGVLYQGKGTLQYSTDGLLQSAEFQEEVAREAEDIQRKIDKIQYIPVLNVGFNYSF